MCFAIKIYILLLRWIYTMLFAIGKSEIVLDHHQVHIRSACYADQSV